MGESTSDEARDEWWESALWNGAAAPGFPTPAQCSGAAGNIRIGIGDRLFLFLILKSKRQERGLTATERIGSSFFILMTERRFQTEKRGAVYSMSHCNLWS